MEGKSAENQGLSDERVVSLDLVVPENGMNLFLLERIGNDPVPQGEILPLFLYFPRLLDLN